MNGAFYIGATGLQSQQHALEVVANNVANINTPAFKRSQVRFSELVTVPATDADGVGPRQASTLDGVRADAGDKIFSQGELKQTGASTDLAIDGDGFLELVGANGESVLWRGGTLTQTSDGFLAGANGLPLKAMIAVPADAQSVQIDRDGLVHAVISGQTDRPEIGHLELVRVKDPAALTALGDSLYTAAPTDLLTDAPGDAGAGALVQGSLEAANVDLSQEMVTLLLMQRAYSANAQVVQAGDQLMAIANGLRR